jgi:hypothetical protein
MARKIVPLVFVLCLVLVTPFLISTSLLQAYFGQFQVSAPNTAFVLGPVMSTSTSLSIALTGLSDTYGSPVAEGEASYMISLYPHCAGYDEYYNCIDEVPVHE